MRYEAQKVKSSGWQHDTYNKLFRVPLRIHMTLKPNYVKDKSSRSSNTNALDWWYQPETLKLHRTPLMKKNHNQYTTLWSVNVTVKTAANVQSYLMWKTDLGASDISYIHPVLHTNT